MYSTQSHCARRREKAKTKRAGNIFADGKLYIPKYGEPTFSCVFTCRMTTAYLVEIEIRTEKSHTGIKQYNSLGIFLVHISEMREFIWFRFISNGNDDNDDDDDSGGGNEEHGRSCSDRACTQIFHI